MNSKDKEVLYAMANISRGHASLLVALCNEESPNPSLGFGSSDVSGGTPSIGDSAPPVEPEVRNVLEAVAEKVSKKKKKRKYVLSGKYSKKTENALIGGPRIKRKYTKRKK